VYLTLRGKLAAPVRVTLKSPFLPVSEASGTCGVTVTVARVAVKSCPLTSAPPMFSDLPAGENVYGAFAGVTV